MIEADSSTPIVQI